MLSSGFINNARTMTMPRKITLNKSTQVLLTRSLTVVESLIKRVKSETVFPTSIRIHFDGLKDISHSIDQSHNAKIYFLNLDSWVKRQIEYYQQVKLPYCTNPLVSY